MLRGVLLKLAAVPQQSSEDSPHKLLPDEAPDSPCGSAVSSQSRQRERNPWVIKASKAAAKLEPRVLDSPRGSQKRKTWYAPSSARIASAPSSPVGNIGPLTRKTWFVAPQRVNLLLSPVPAITAPLREPPVPAAAAPRKKWYMSAPSPTHKAAVTRTERQQQQQSAAAAAAPSARKKWYRPPLSRSASSSTRLQLKAAPPSATEVLQPQPLLEEEQESAAISDDSSHKSSSRLWRRRSMSSVPLQQQQQQLEQRPPAHTFEIDEDTNASTTSDNDDDDDEEDECYVTPVPEALLYRDAQWPAGSKALQQALLAHSKKCHCAENYVFIASVRAYKSRLSTGDVAGADAQRAMIIEKFINAGELQVNLASWTVEETLSRAASRDAHCFDAAADEICKLMSTDIWHKFIKSVEYLSLTAVERHSAYSTALVLRSGVAPAVSGCAANRQHRKVLLPPQQTIAPAHCSALHKAAAAAAAAADVDDGNSSSTSSTSSTSTSSTSCASSRSSMISSSSMSALPSYSASGARSSSSRRGITSSSSMGKLTSYGTTATSISSGMSSKPLRRSSIDSPRPGAFTNGPFFGSSSSGDRFNSSSAGCADRYNNSSSNNKWQQLQCEVEAVASGLKVLGAAQEHLAARSALLLD
eukprot:16987-Heterococcus_DN1.PRE.3